MAQTKAQLLGPVVGDVVMDVSTLSLDAEGNKVGIGHSEPDLTLHVSGVNGLPSSSGSTPTGHLTIRNKAGSTHGMFMGVSDASPWSSWIQAQDASNNATNYPLLLNPNGGNVGIGTDSPTANFKLDVNGDLSLGESGGTDNTYIDQKQNGSLDIINSGRESNSGQIRINKTNDISGDTTYFRDFLVYDGKQNILIAADGSTGNVGIGTETPSYKLQVENSGTTLGRFLRTNAGAGLFQIMSQDGGSITLGLGDVSDPDIQYIKSDNSDNSLSFGTDADERLRITSGGSVGIGTDAPGALLHLESTAANAAGLRIGFDSPRYYDIFRGSTTNSGYLNFYGSQSNFVGYIFDGVDGELMRISLNGNVGVGDDNPSDKFTVYKSSIGNPTGITIRNTEASSTYSHARLRLESQNGAAYAHLWADVANTALRLGYNSSSTVNIYDNGKLTSPNQIVAGTTFGIANVSGSIAGIGGGQDYIGLRHGTTFGLMLKTAGTNVGNVGIGQVSPQGDLHIGNISGSKDLIMHSANNGDARVRFREGGSNTSGFNEYSIGMVGNRNAMTINGQGAGEIISILGDTGFVGINDTNPARAIAIKYNDNTAYSESAYTPAGGVIKIFNESTTAGCTAGELFFGSGNSGTGYAAISCIRPGSQEAELAFRVMDSATFNEAIRINKSGNVGIGTDNPTTRLEVERATAGTIAKFYDTGSNGGALYNGGPIVGISRVSNGSVSLDGLLFQVGWDKINSTSYNISETVFCVGNKGVGIGEDEPQVSLHLSKNLNTTSSYKDAQMIRISGTGGANHMAGIGFGYNSGSPAGSIYPSAWIGAKVSSWTSYVKHDLIFATRGADTNTEPEERFRITEGGVLIQDYDSQYVQRGYFDTQRSGQNASNCPTLATNISYGFGYQEAFSTTNGNWVHPYPDLVLGYHTGMRFGGHYNYGGCRFYADHPSGSSAIYMSIGNGGTGVTVTNTLSKGGGSFRIAHPHPSKKWTHDLVHSFIEGPQMDLIYRGKIDLVDGSATVNIDTNSNMTDGTFVLLNRDVQCFTSNETGWTAVKGSVSGNILTITAQDNSCTDTISWMVIGERQDDKIKSLDMTDDDGNLIVEPLTREESHM